MLSNVKRQLTNLPPQVDNELSESVNASPFGGFDVCALYEPGLAEPFGADLLCIITTPAEEHASKYA